MSNPFEAPDTDYTVLRNALNQHSLWPAAIAAPNGWTVVHGPSLRADCLGYVREHWVDLRPSDVAEFIATVSERYPLTSQQKDPDHTERSPRHIIPTALRIKGEVRGDALKGALDDVVARHEALRTRVHYSETDGTIGYQQVLPPLPVPFAVHDIPVVPDRSRDEVAADLYVRLHEERIEFTDTPSLRAALHRFDDRDAVLTLLTHHLFGDNWSLGVLIRDIAACYNARVSGTPHALPTPVQYREYASWEHEFLRSEKAATARRFWAERLSGARMYAMPAERPSSPETMTPRSAITEVPIGPDNSAKIVAAATRNRCTPWHLFVAAAALLAQKVRGSSDVTLLTVNNGRNAKGFNNTIGFFANLMPIRVEFGDCGSFREVLLRVRKASVDAHRNLLPFGEVLELAPDLMEAFEGPLAMPFVVNYARSPAALTEIQFADRVEPVVSPEEVPAMYHRGAFMWGLTMLRSGTFRCVVEYEPAAVDADTVDRWGSEFVDLVLAIADTPERAWKNQ